MKDSTMISRATWIWTTVSVLAVMISNTAFAMTEEDIAELSSKIDGIENESGTIEGSVTRLYENYVKPLQIEDVRYFERRFENGKWLFNAKDYVNAAILFQDLLSFKDVKGRTQYPYVMYYLGACLYKNHNYSSAQKYLNDVVREGRNFEHFQDAVMMLIHISINLNNFEQAEKHYQKIANMQGGGEGWDLIQYSFGKSLYKGEKWAKAKRAFEGIGSGSSFKYKADYFIGAILTAQKKLKEAAAHFEKMRAYEVKTDKERNIRELATLGLARLHYEYASRANDQLQEIIEGLPEPEDGEEERKKTKKELDLETTINTEFQEALKLYREIPIESPFFDQAYYEISWIYIANRKYPEAANTIDILLLAMPGSMYAPESLLLKGNIQLWKKEYKGASDTFETIVNRYQRVVEVLSVLASKAQGKKAEDIQADILGKKSDLPLVALKWIEQEEDVTDAMQVSKALEESQADSMESLKIVDELLVHLTQEAKANIFPTMKEGREKGKELEHKLTDINSQLLSMGDVLAGKQITEADRQRLEELKKQREELEKKHAALPKTPEEREARRQKQVETMERIKHMVTQLKYQMESLDKVLNDVLAKRDALRGDPTMSKNFQSDVEKTVNREREDNEAMMKLVDELLAETTKEVERAKVGVYADNQDRQIRDELEQVVNEEKEVLSRMRDSLPPGALALVERTENIKRKNDNTQRKLESFYKELELLVAGRVADLDRQVREEQRQLNKYIAEIEKKKSEAVFIAARMAASGLKSVRNRFYDLVLKADMGLVDIAWDARQKLKDRRLDLLERMNLDKGTLESTFREARRD